MKPWPSIEHRTPQITIGHFLKHQLVYHSSIKSHMLQMLFLQQPPKKLVSLSWVYHSLPGPSCYCLWISCWELLSREESRLYMFLPVIQRAALSKQCIHFSWNPLCPEVRKLEKKQLQERFSTATTRCWVSKAPLAHCVPWVGRSPVSLEQEWCS